MRPSISACVLAVAALLSIAAPGAAAPASAPRTFDLVTYTPPDGFTVDDASPDHVSIVRSGSKSYCVIGIYGADAASADLDASFAAQWQRVVPTSVDPVAAPAATHGDVGNAHAAIGGAMSTLKGQPVFVLLTVVDAGADVVTIVVLTPSIDDLKVYQPSLQFLLASLVVRRVEASAPAPSDPAAPAPGPGTIPPPPRLTVGDLAGDWKHDDHAMTSYVSASTGAYAGFDSIATKEAWTITAKGVLKIDFWGVTAGNGGARGISEKRVASIAISDDHILTIKYKKGQGADAQYLIRGWLVGPELTVLQLNGPWYAPTGVPADVRADPHMGSNLDALWVRASKPAR